jgi:RND family efflux transporter MFP subunit
MSLRAACGAALLLAGATLLGCSKPPPTKPESGPPVVTVARPRVEKITRYADLTGQLDAVQTVQVRPRVSGIIVRVDMKDGQLVEGEVSVWGFVLRPGTLLFQIDPVTYDADLKQAQAQVGIVNAQLELAQKNEAREKESWEKGVSSRQNYETFIAQTKVAVAQLEAAKNGVVKAQQNLDWTNVTAPISGRTDRALLTAGNVAVGGQTQGTILTTIKSMDPMYAYFDVDDQTVLYYQRLVRDKKIAKPRDGEETPVEIQLKGEVGYPHKGTIDFLSNTISPSTGSLQIRGIFPNKDGMLTPGLFVRGRVPIGEPVDAVLVPDEAVIADQGQKIVYVVNDKNVVESRVVTPGPTAHGLRVVEGLAPTERIIIKGFQRVRPGVEVAPEDGTIQTDQQRMTP